VSPGDDRECTLDMLKQYRDLGVDQVMIFKVDFTIDGFRSQIDKVAEELIVPGKDI